MASGASEPFTSSASSNTSLSSPAGLTSGRRVLMPSALAYVSVATLSVPMMTSLPRHENSA